MNMDAVLVPLLDGFEEIEAVTIIDVLRRADIPVIVAAEHPGPVQGSHGISIVATDSLRSVDAQSLAMIALPGGMPGSKNLAEHELVQRLIRQVASAGGWTVALCAAPMALASAGVHTGRKVTCYPGFEKYLDGAIPVEDRVVVDGRVVTSRGPGTALEFALTLVGLLRGADVKADLEKKMLALR